MTLSNIMTVSSTKLMIKKFASGDSGATLVEYGVALLVVIIVGSVTITALATAVGDEITETTSAF